ncbi:hypothetical protein RMSM_03056 [Rhodopirellula maiorica SM1]|uniref:Uncharacterized protein n=1 Tax=Rhodopirellula maiorica SM1 TaxID=1265738 RepID=M5RX85_9BACT|nr:hypothetical protein RMSM_03056 [Rhodopirellula maiorica SM1]
MTQSVSELTSKLSVLIKHDAVKTDREIDTFVAEIRQTIAPLNRVGLFTPPIPNMYHQTAAK